MLERNGLTAPRVRLLPLLPRQEYPGPRAWAGLLLIPYLLRGYDMAMSGQGRFVGAAVPVYLALGNLLAHWPPAVSFGLLGASAFYLGLYAAMFAAGYLFV